jgi:hypothetical protein
MEIDLVKGFVAVIDDEDAELVAGFKWYPMKVAGKLHAAGWKHMPPGRFFVLLHRLITNAHRRDHRSYRSRSIKLPEEQPASSYAPAE